jgi:hypothetical protein
MSTVDQVSIRGNWAVKGREAKDILSRKDRR